MFAGVHLRVSSSASKPAEVNSMVDMSPKVPTKRPESLKQQTEESKKPVTGAKSRAERGANAAAHKAAKHEQEFDQNQATVSK